MSSLQWLLDERGFVPRWECGDWSDGLAWLHIGSDVATWGAYFAIPCVLVYFIRRRADFPFRSLLFLFAAFILACGTGHLIEAAIFWHPVYRLSGVVKLMTAGVSWATVLVLAPIVPRVLALRSPDSLQREIEQRRNAEEKLIALNTSLEERVADRTRRAEEANRAKSEFLANMSHEVRTPINAMLGYADMLSDPAVPQAQKDHAAAAVRRNGAHLLRLINDVLDLSKVEAGKMELEFQPHSPQQAVADALAATRLQATEFGVALAAETKGPTPRLIPTDATRLRQILMNLIGNAVKHSGAEQVVVRISVDDRGESEVVRLRFDVADDGRGIPAEQLPRLFEPFQQGDNSLTRRRGGAGLGLSISRRLADALGGELSVASREGDGATFSLQIPIPRPEAGQWVEEGPIRDDYEHAKGKETNRLRNRRGKVLVVDDGIDNQRIVAYYLSSAGYEVVAAENGREALAQIERQPFQLILMDMQMPVMDGYSTTTQLRGRGVQIPIIALTAHAMRGEREKCLSAGCNDFLVKPVAPEELLHCVGAHLIDAEGVGSDRIASGQEFHSEFQDDSKFMVLVREYVAQLPSLADRIRRTFRKGDLPGIERIAHDVKGAAGMYGFSSLSRQAEALMRSIQKGDSAADVRPLMEATTSLMDAIVGAHGDADDPQE